MPRYFFRIRKGDILVQDPEGIEVSLGNSLEEEAAEAARDLLSDGNLHGLDRREWVYEVVNETGTTVLTLPFKEAVEADLPAAAMTQECSPADQPCPHCSGSGTECEAVAVLGKNTLAFLKESDACFGDCGGRADMQCTLCSGSGFVTATVRANIAWAKNVLGENSAAGRRKWSPKRRAVFTHALIEVDFRR